MLADNIKKYRKKFGFSQKDLAEQLFLTPQTISKWEKGLSEPNLKDLCKLSTIFSISTDELLGNSLKQDEPDAMIAVDGGGTKTDFVLFYQNGKIIDRITLGGSSPNVYGMDNTISVIRSGIDFLRSDKNINLKGIYMGVAGAMSGTNAQKMTKQLKSIYSGISLNVTSDIDNVIGCADGIQNCVSVICGTGSIFYAKEENELHRIGGWGYHLDEFGSGFTLGRDALRAALAENDGIGPKTLITKLIEDALEASIWNKIDVIYSKGVDFIASFSKMVFKAYEMGDSIAAIILDKNISYIANMINIAEKKYNIGSNVVLSGGVINNNRDVFLSFLNQKLDKKMNIVVPDLPQIYGAAVNCCNLYSEMHPSFSANFKNDIIKNSKEKVL